MSSLFQALMKVKIDKKSRSKSSHKRQSKSKRSKSQKKKFFKADDQLQTHYSQLSSSTISPVKKGNVERIIGKACLDLPENENSIFYLVKWKNKKIEESTWEDCQMLQHAKQKIKWFNENVKPQSLPNFYKQYKLAEPNYEQILENFIKKFTQRLNEANYNLHKEKSDKKIFLQKCINVSDQIRNKKTKKIKKKRKSKYQRSKELKNKISQRNEQTSLQISKKSRIRYTKKAKKQRLLQWIEYYKKYQKIKQEQSRKEDNFKKSIRQGYISEPDEISKSPVFSKATDCQDNQDWNIVEQNDKTTNYQTEIIQDFIFLSDTYKNQDSEIITGLNLESQTLKEKQQIVQFESVKDEYQIQPGEITFDKQTLLYSRFIEIQEGEFTEADFINMTIIYSLTPQVQTVQKQIN